MTGLKSRNLKLPVCCSLVSNGARATPSYLKSSVCCRLFVAFAWLLPPGAEPGRQQAAAACGHEYNFRPGYSPHLWSIPCFRCHGPEKPKSDFCLAFRNQALQGGDENTNDIVPGDSARSYLIYYVARQVADMEMPPEGRGDPLTPQQVALLRAWIDQGAAWGTNSTPPPTMIAARALVALDWCERRPEKIS